MNKKITSSVLFGFIIFLIEAYTTIGMTNGLSGTLRIFTMEPVLSIIITPLLAVIVILEFFPAWAIGLLLGFIFYLIASLFNRFLQNNRSIYTLVLVFVLLYVFSIDALLLIAGIFI